MVKYVICKNKTEMGEKCAEIIAEQLIKKKNTVLGLATGSSPVPTYKKLIDLCEEEKISFSDVKAFNLDEYVGLASYNIQSYAYFMADNLFNHIDIKQENTHIPNGIAEDIEDECKRYDSLLAANGQIDLQLLGIGVNGHIGFNEPSDAFSGGTLCVDLTNETINSNSIFFDKQDDVPKKAITMGIQSIMKSKKIILLASGIGKLDALKKAFTGEITPWLPASVLQTHPDVTVIGDKEALSYLD